MGKIGKLHGKGLRGTMVRQGVKWNAVKDGRGAEIGLEKGANIGSHLLCRRKEKGLGLCKSAILRYRSDIKPAAMETADVDSFRISVAVSGVPRVPLLDPEPDGDGRLTTIPRGEKWTLCRSHYYCYKPNEPHRQCFSTQSCSPRSLASFAVFTWLSRGQLPKYHRLPWNGRTHFSFSASRQLAQHFINFTINLTETITIVLALALPTESVNCCSVLFSSFYEEWRVSKSQQGSERKNPPQEDTVQRPIQ